MTSRCRERSHNRHRRGNHQRARARDDEQHERAIDPRRRLSAGDQRRHCRDDHRQREHDRRVDAREAIDERLDGRTLCLRGLDQMDDPRQPAVTAETQDTHLHRAAAVDRPRVDLVARLLVDRPRLARERRLVDVAAPTDHQAIERHLFARADDDLVARSDRIHRNPLLAAVAPDERLARRQVDQRPYRLPRAFHRPDLEPLRDGKEEHDARGFRPVAERERSDHRDHHQHVDIEDARARSGERAACRKGNADSRTRHIERHRRARQTLRLEERGDEQKAAANQHELPARIERRAADHRLLGLEPHPHTGLAHGIDHRGCGELGGVVLHVQPLPDEIGRERLEAGKRLQPPLEDDHLFITVHPLDAEDRLRVKLTDRARDRFGSHPLMETLSLSSWIPAERSRETSGMGGRV